MGSPLRLGSPYLSARPNGVDVALAKKILQATLAVPLAR
jgi:hypothetical protein